MGRKIKSPRYVHLPPSARYFVGRRRELRTLHAAWSERDPALITIVGLGGIGKSALVRNFLNRITSGPSEQPDALFIWSFYEDADTRECLRELYSYLTDNDHVPENSQFLPRLTYELENAGHVLLVLDGLERVQDPKPGNTFGCPSDPLLRDFLLRIVDCIGEVQTIVTTRYPLNLVGTTTRQLALQLAQLGSAESAKLLRAAGVKGQSSDLVSAINSIGGHPLALTLMANLAANYYDGDISRIPDLLKSEKIDNAQDRNLSHILAEIESQLSELELELLARIAVFRTAPTIDLIYEVFGNGKAGEDAVGLYSLTSADFERMIEHMQRLGLINVTDDHRCVLHPIIRQRYYSVLGEPGKIHQVITSHFNDLVGTGIGDKPVSGETAHFLLELIYQLSSTRNLDTSNIQELSKRLDSGESPTAKAFSLLLEASLNLQPSIEIQKSEELGPVPQVFISYVREDEGEIAVLRTSLEQAEIGVWQDKDSLVPGKRWKDDIRRAIRDGDAFCACFSENYWNRGRTYMNEELQVAVDELRLRPRESGWFFPVMLSECEVPEIPIGPGETLRDLQRVNLFEDWGNCTEKLIKAIKASR